MFCQSSQSFQCCLFVFFRAASVRRESVRDPSPDTVMLTGLLYALLNKVQKFCSYIYHASDQYHLVYNFDNVLKMCTNIVSNRLEWLWNLTKLFVVIFRFIALVVYNWLRNQLIEMFWLYNLCIVCECITEDCVGCRQSHISCSIFSCPFVLCFKTIPLYKS